MLHRFFVELPIDSDHATLTGAEAHHMRNVLRASAGDEVALFDGTGVEYRAQIQQLGRARVELRIIATQPIDRELTKQVIFGVALPKGERQRWLVEKLVELGARRLVPLHTLRGVVQPSSSTLVRLRRVVIEASKQCGRNRLMEVLDPVSLADYVESAPGAARRWLADPAAAQMPNLAIRTPGMDTYLLIGPEGGLTDEERDTALRFGWQPISLGKRILRIETAALAAATLAAHDIL